MPLDQIGAGLEEREMLVRLTDVDDIFLEGLVLARHDDRYVEAVGQHLAQCAGPVRGPVEDNKHDGFERMRKGRKQSLDVLQALGTGGSDHNVEWTSHGDSLHG
jgi:hypothetical protein